MTAITHRRDTRPTAGTRAALAPPPSASAASRTAAIAVLPFFRPNVRIACRVPCGLS
jgi:hypothetical protein